MEILSVKLKAIVLGVLLLTLGMNLNAQSHEDLQKAFADSYSYESIGKYTDAIQSIKKYYSAESYEMNLRLAWLNYLSGQFTESISYYSKSIKLQPLSIEARLYLRFDRMRQMSLV